VSEPTLKSVFAGIGSVISKSDAELAPLLTNPIVYTRSVRDRTVPVGLTLAVNVTLGVGIVAGTALTLFVSIVTAPFRAITLPVVLTRVVIVILVFAITFPRKAVSVPKVAD